MAKSYSAEFISQIIKEANEVGSSRVVALKHNIPESTVYGWYKGQSTPKADTNSSGKDKFFEQKNKALKRKLSDVELENQILKDLLKKTYQVFPIEKK